ncbi:GlxA family transcriptional regulator [Pararhodobacter marinus]|uniref:GlxA family transcriptional regulator n=1 Tax=Pararhodobacter marinus TaxID=2184063 RepID=UPI0035114C9E
MRRIAFLLIDGHALLSTASALEPLRAANLFSDGQAFEVTLLSRNGGATLSSVGASFPTRPYREVALDFDLIFVAAGGDPARVSDPALFAWLRQADRQGIALGGISGGAVILAKAGLLDQRRFTVHWHHYEDFEALGGAWLLERRLFVIDRDRYTCAGGAAPLDMMHAIIARTHGTAFAQRISDWFIQTEIRSPEAPQTASIAARYGALPGPVTAALELMESHIADPLSHDQLAALAGLSARQLQRQFNASLGRSVMAEYRRIRLETARDLIVSTRLPLSEIALMTGFARQANFTEAFRAQFGAPPSSLRARKEAD